MDVTLHATADIDRQADVERKHVAEIVAVFRVALAEIRDALGLPLFDDFEVFGFEPGDGDTLLVGEHDREVDEVDCGLEALLGHRRGQRRGDARGREPQDSLAPTGHHRVLP